MGGGDMNFYPYEKGGGGGHNSSEVVVKQYLELVAIFKDGPKKFPLFKRVRAKCFTLS